MRSTRRNTRNNLRVVFRLAEAHGLLAAPLPPRLLAKPQAQAFQRQQRETAPYQTTYRRPDRPPPLRPAPGAVAARYPAPAGGPTGRAAACASGRRRSRAMRSLWRPIWAISPISAAAPPTWDDVFDVAQLTEFVRWHGAGLGRPVSVHGRTRGASMIAAMAKVLKHPRARALADLRNALQAARAPAYQAAALGVPGHAGGGCRGLSGRGAHPACRPTGAPGTLGRSGPRDFSAG